MRHPPYHQGPIITLRPELSIVPVKKSAIRPKYFTLHSFESRFLLGGKALHELASLKFSSLYRKIGGMNSPPTTLRSHDLVSRADSRLLIVDVQEKLVPLIPTADRLIHNCRRLMVGAEIMHVPIFVTEQYPKGLGKTVESLRNLAGNIPEKLRFSCAESLNWGTAAEQTDSRFQIVVAGIEAHVCVLQTVLDLLADGFQIFVVADAVASRGEFDWKIALDRMAASGASIVTTESVLFEWCECSGTAEFKQISQLIKEAPSR